MQRITITLDDDLLAEIDAAAAEAIAPRPAKVRPRPMPRNVHPRWPLDNRVVESEGAVAELVGIEGGVVSGVINLESSGVEASDWRPRHDEQ
jgi:Ribbon-helix-helix protein, copG family